MILLAYAAPCLAVDGVLEINQTCATTGCFPGDTGGFPVTITQSGSYRLTSSLDTSPSSVTAIQVDANEVTIDLNGFTLSGTDAGSVSGIAASTNRVRTTVRNGVVRDFGGDGVSLDDYAVVEHLTAHSNGTNGILVDNDSRVAHCTATSNNSYGVYAGNGTLIANVASSDNGGHGIAGGRSVTVRDSTSENNGATGISIANQGMVVNNTIYSNGYHGILGGTSATIIGNSVWNNDDNGIQTGNGAIVKDNSVMNNLTGDGIVVMSDAVIAGNSVRNNGSATDDNQIEVYGSNDGGQVTGNSVSAASGTGYGLLLSTTTGYAHNTVNSAGLGTVSGGVNQGGNACGTTTTCP